MARTRNRGPLIALGALLDTAAPTVYDGPSMFYNGEGLLDPRYYPANKDSQNAGIFPGWAQGGVYELVNAIPSAAATAVVCFAQNAVSVTPFGFVTASPGSSNAGVPTCVNSLPIIPFQGNSVVNVFAIDYGFTTGTTTAGSPTIASMPDTSILAVGQWICVGGVGAAANTTSQIVQITKIINASSILVGANIVAALTGAPIGLANQVNSGGFYPNPAQMTPNAALGPYVPAGEALIFDARAAVARAIVICGGASTTGGTFIVAGYDTYGVAMHETIVASTSNTAVYGKKAFKYLTSVTPQFADAHPYTVGTSDVYGFPLYSGTFERTQIYWNGTAVTGSPAWTTGLSFTYGVATYTTADVRGTIQTSGDGGGSHSVGSVVSDGSAVRLYVSMTLSTNQVTNTSNVNPNPLLGLPQV